MLLSLTAAGQIQAFDTGSSLLMSDYSTISGSFSNPLPSENSLFFWGLRAGQFCTQILLVFHLSLLPLASFVSRLSFQSFPTLCHSFNSSIFNYEVDEAHRVGIAASPRTLFCCYGFSSGYGMPIFTLKSRTMLIDSGSSTVRISPKSQY